MKGIAGDQGEARVSGRREDTDVGWIDDEGIRDAVFVDRGRGGEENLVAILNVCKVAEVGIAMRGEGDVAELARKRRAGEMADGFGER